MPDDKIEIENVNTPGRTERVDRAKYIAMRDALLNVSGRLDRTMGGPSVLPHLTPFLVGRGRPASPRFLVNPLPRTAEMTETPKTTAGAVSVDSVVSAARGRSRQ